MTVRTPQSWLAATANAGFAVTSTYDGDRSSRPRVPAGRSGPLLWHELVRRA
jgi:hypothetical protein